MLFKIELVLTYMEWQLLLQSARADDERRRNGGTVSDWHDSAASLREKLEKVKLEQL